MNTIIMPSRELVEYIKRKKIQIMVKLRPLYPIFAKAKNAPHAGINAC
jgi:hypothetical protein